MTRQVRRATLTRFAVRMGLGAVTAAGVAALAVPAGASSAVALAIGAGGLVVLSGLGANPRRPRVTARRRG